MTVFTIRNLSWTYPGSVKPVLNHFSLEISAGKTTVLLGPSGSGKTTFVQILGLLWDGAGMVGEVTFHKSPSAFPYSRMSQREKDSRREADFGFILQNSYVLPQFNCWWNIALPLLLKGMDEAKAKEIAFRLLKEEAGIARDDGLGKGESLWDKRESSAREFSQGQRQRIAILRAIANNPTVIFADEPTSNLDPGTASHISELLRNWKNGRLGIGGEEGPRSLIVVTHNLQHAYHADYLAGDLFVKIERNGHGDTVPNIFFRDSLTGIDDLSQKIGHNL